MIVNYSSKTALITGCFDILHRKHFELIKFANKFADKLIVALDSDNKVKIDKGFDRPFNCEEDRKFVLECISGVSEVIFFNSEEELLALLKEIMPDIRIVGGDWKGKKIVGEEYCGEVVFFDRVPGYSTTNVLSGVKPK